MSKITHLGEEEFTAFVAHGVSLVDYWATWCGPCKMVAPVLEEVAEIIGEKAKVGKVDVDECPDLANKAEVQAIPNICVYKNGEIVDRIIGVDSAENIVALIEKYL